MKPVAWVGIIVATFAGASCKKQETDQRAARPPDRGLEATADILRLTQTRFASTMKGHPFSIELPDAMTHDAMDDHTFLFGGLRPFSASLELWEYDDPQGAGPLDEAFGRVMIENSSTRGTAQKPRVLDDGVLVVWTDPQKTLLKVDVMKKQHTSTKSWKVRCSAEWVDREPLVGYENLQPWTENICLSLRLGAEGP